MNKKSTLTTLLGSLVLVTLLTSCSMQETETPDTSKSDATGASLEVLKQETVTTVCSVQNARRITQQNVDDFHATALKLSHYTGKQEEKIHKVAYELKVLADSWEVNLNQDLGEENAAALKTLCESVQQYQ